MVRSIGRRDFFFVTASSILGMVHSVTAQAPSSGSDPLRILLLSSYMRGIFYFNLAGVYVEVGQAVQWVGLSRARSVTAFHPSIDNHELRIPENARPFDSRTMASGSPTFKWTFDVEGTYDYYCRPMENKGMVGRIVVGKPGGPGERPPGYGNREGRAVMYPDAARLLEYLKSDEIVRTKSIPCPLELLQRKFPGRWR